MMTTASETVEERGYAPLPLVRYACGCIGFPPYAVDDLREDMVVAVILESHWDADRVRWDGCTVRLPFVPLSLDEAQSYEYQIRETLRVHGFMGSYWR